MLNSKTLDDFLKDSCPVDDLDVEVLELITEYRKLKLIDHLSEDNYE